jgi:hypothetical protein
MGNLLEIERFVLPSPPALSIQNLGDLAITTMIQQAVDLRDDLRLCLPNLSDRQWLDESETSGGATAETHMDLDHLSVDQRHILDE